MTHDDDALILYGERFASRLLLGTSRYPSPKIMADAVAVARPAMVTASLRRETAQGQASQEFWQLLKAMAVPVLPNTPAATAFRRRSPPPKWRVRCLRPTGSNSS